MAIATPSAAALALGRAAGQEIWDALITRPVKGIPILTTAASRIVVARPCILVGWQLAELAGAAAIWSFIDGQDGTGEILGSFTLTANTNSSMGLAPEGPLCRGGIFLLRTSGTIGGGVWVKI